MLKLNSKMSWNIDTIIALDTDDEITTKSNIVLQNILICQKNLERLESLLRNYKRNKDRNKNKTMFKEIILTKSEMKNKLEKCNKILTFVKTQLKNKQEIQQDPEIRMALMRTDALQAKIFDIVKKQGRINLKLKKIARVKVYDEIRLLDDTITPNEVDDYMRNPEKIIALQEKQTYGSKKSKKVKNKLEDMKEKVEDLRKMDEEVQKLAELTKTLQSIMQQNSEKIDSIEANIIEVRDYMEKAANELQSGKEQYSQAMQKFCCAFVVVLIIAILVVNYLLNTIGLG